MTVWAQDCYASRNCALWQCVCTLLRTARNGIRRFHLTLYTAEVRIPVIIPTIKCLALRQLGALDWTAFDNAILQRSLLDSVEIEVVNGDTREDSSCWLQNEVGEMAKARLSQKSSSVLSVL